MTIKPSNGGERVPGTLLDRPLQEAEWMSAIRRHLDEGQGFLAYDLALAALNSYPDSTPILLLGTLALLRSGAEAQARQLFAPLADRMEPRSPRAHELLRQLRGVGRQLLSGDPAAEPSNAELEQLVQLAETVMAVGGGERTEATTDLESLKLFGEIHFEWWQHSGREEDLRRGRAAFLECFQREGSLENGINAALLSSLLGLEEEAHQIAIQLLPICRLEVEGPRASRRFRAWSTEAEAHLLLGDAKAALAALECASHLPEIHYSWVAKCRSRLALMAQNGIPVPDGVDELVPPPVVVIFAGQELDPPDPEFPLFPPYLEEAVRREIRTRLDQLDAHVGYCSAACGSDLLFIEAMVERDAEVHIFLPCAVEDFVATRVARAGPRWERRFRIALKLAATVNYATEERLLGHDLLFRFNNQIIDGMARLRAQLLQTDPHLLLVWDYAADSAAGTAADFMDQWPDITRLRLIDLDELREANPPPASGEAAPCDHHPPPPPERQEPSRVIKTMLFADIVGFSKLREEDLPGLWRMLAFIGEKLGAACTTPDLVESWGDALYVVMPTASDLLRYAFALQAGFGSCSPRDFDLPYTLQLRVGLHAGPVYEGVHPLTGRGMIYGSHVSRTARIEPVTVPGQIYASQQFVAMLTMEESGRVHRQSSVGETPEAWYRCAYLGIQALAKKYGSQPVYHLRPMTG